MSILHDDLMSLLFDFTCNNPCFLIYFKKNFNFKNKLKRINCYELSNDRVLSLEFIELFYNQIKWDVISRYTLLDESILYKYYEKLNWKYISLYQNMSFDFIMINYDFLYEKKLKHNKNYSKDFIQNIIYKKRGDKFMFKIVHSNKRYSDLKYHYGQQY